MAVDSFIEYLSLEKNYSPHTVAAYRRDLLAFYSFCNEEFETGSLERANYPMIRHWIVSLVESGISNRSVNRKIASLKSFYKYLLKTGTIDHSPLQKHRALKTDTRIEIPLSLSEMQELLNEIPFEEGFRGKRDSLVIELLYTTGIRRAELINLKKGDVDLSQATIKVLGKRNKERMLPLLPATVLSFHAYFKSREEEFPGLDEPHIFLSNSGNKIYETLVYRIINGYLSMVSSKVKKSPHILRHTFATHLLNHGADLNSVKELLGHASLASTQVYTHTGIAELKKVHSNAHPRSKE